MTGAERHWWHSFAVHGIFWRRFVDWSVGNLPTILQRLLIWIAAFLFFFVAAPARKSVLRNLRLIRPASWRVMNCLRVLRVFTNFGWSLTDAATYRMSKTRFKYELEGGRFLDQLAAARGGVVLTAHMGNYDLGAALFAEKFHRQIQMVRAPEPDALRPTRRSCFATIERRRGQSRLQQRWNFACIRFAKRSAQWRDHFDSGRPCGWRSRLCAREIF